MFDPRVIIAMPSTLEIIQLDIGNLFMSLLTRALQSAKVSPLAFAHPNSMKTRGALIKVFVV